MPTTKLATKSKIALARRTKPFLEMDAQLLSMAADVMMSRIARATTHVGHRRPRGQFETLAELAYCALDEEQLKGVYSFYGRA